MYNLRRLRLPALPARYRPSFDRRTRLRGANKRLAEALSQLSLGVPLNWGQVEDDPELETLADINYAAQECRRSVVGSVPPEVRARVIERLSRRLPAPKPRKVSAAPKSLAGFSENVQVLTQVEEDVPSLISNVPQWIGATFAAGIATIGIMWVLSNAFFPVYIPQYDWIEVRQGGKTVAQLDPEKKSAVVRCAGFSLTNPEQQRKFIRLPDDRKQIRSSVGFPVAFLPKMLALTDTIQIKPTVQVHGTEQATVQIAAQATVALTTTRTLTYSFALTDMSVAPCVGERADPADPGAVVKLSYVAQVSTAPKSGTSTPLTFFQAREQPVSLDAGNGTWKEVNREGGRGVYWRGAPYRDVEGNAWIGDVSVLIIERNGIISTLVGQANQQISEEMLLRLWTSSNTER